MIRSVFFLIFGLALGVLVHEGRAPRPEPVSPPARSPVKLPASRESPAPSLPEVESEAPLPATGVPSPTATPIELLAHAIESIDGPIVARDEWIEGVALDANQRPAAGVRVRVQPLEPMDSGHRTSRETLQHGNFAQFVYDRVVDHRFVAEATRTTTTDRTGHFRLDALPFARYSIEAEFPGRGASCSIIVEDARRDWASPHEWVVIREISLYSVAFDVVRADGTRPERAKIRNTTVQEEYDWTPERRVFQVREGRQRFVVEEEGQAVVQTTIAADRLDPPLRFSLERQAAIDLTVIFPPEEEDGVEFEVWLAKDPGRRVDADWLMTHASEPLFFLFASVDPAAEVADRPVETVSLAPLEPGTYWVGVGRTQIEQFIPLTVGAGERIAWTFEMLSPAADALLEVRVFDAAGEPFDAASFRLVGYPPGEGGRGRKIEVGHRERSVAEGVWSLTLDSIGEAFRSGEREGELVLVVQSYGAIAREVVVDAPRIDVRLSPTSSLELVFEGLTENEQVYAVVASPNGEILFESWCSGGAPVVLSPILQRDVLAYIFGGEATVLLIDSLPIVIGKGEERVTVRLPPRYDLVVRVPETGLEGVPWTDGVERSSPLSLYPVEPRHVPSWAGSVVAYDDEGTGEFRFEGIPPGRYLVHPAHGNVYRAMRVVVDRDLEVVFEPTEFHAFRVSGFPSEENPLRLGDRIIGVEGEEFRNSAMMALFEMSLWNSVQTIRLLVDRDGSRIEVEVPRGAGRDQFRDEINLLPDLRE